jgi:hypothetical protein
MEVSGQVHTTVFLSREKFPFCMLKSGLCGPTVDLDILKKIKISSQCSESEHISSAVYLDPSDVTDGVYKPL